MKRIILIIGQFIIAGLLFGQNIDDALRYSDINFGGTARYVGMGGAFGALGADFTSLSTNPAGIGIYRTSEFTMTPSFYINNTSSNYFDKTMEENTYNFNISNLGVVMTLNLSADRFKEDANHIPTWKNINFGIGYNRSNNFHKDYVIEGFNDESSLMNDFLSKAQSIAPDELNDFDTRLAFDTYLLDTINGSYFSAAPANNVLQQNMIESYGAMNEVVMTMGANFDNKLYIGGTFGIPYIHYNQHTYFTEIDETNIAPVNVNTGESLNKYSYNQDLETNGAGFNFKFGMIYRFNEFVRIGGAIHTPTFYSMTDYWNTEVTSEMDNGTTYTSKSPEGSYDYSLITPFKAIGSIAIVFGKMGLLSADYEYIDYSEASLDAVDYGFFEENQVINENLTATQNIRLGTEWVLNPILFRGGFALYGNPYAEGNNSEKTIISAGIGLREQNYFLDFGYAYTTYNRDLFLYSSSLTPVSSDFTNHTLLMTLGLKF